MTENEAKILLNSIKEDNNWGGSIPEVFSIAIKALSEIQQYRAIGTVEELQELKKKETPKKPDIEGDGYADGHLVYDTWICPCCDKRYEIDYDNYDYCPNCGQHIDRSDLE